MQNIDLSGKRGRFSLIKMDEEVLAFGDTEIEKKYF